MGETEGVVYFGAFVAFCLALYIFFLVIKINRKNLKHQAELHEIQQAKQRDMLQAAFEAQERERDRMGRDVHDDVGPMLSTLKFSVAKIKRLKEKEAINETIKTINKEIDQVVKRVRAVSRDLSPVILNDFGLDAALDDLCVRINMSNETKAIYDYQLPENLLDKKTELAIYRIVQESCNNTLKHAEASELLIRLQQVNKQVQVTVTDNGKGLPADQLVNGKSVSRGIGRRNMEARASMINAEFWIESAPNSGTKTVLQFVPTIEIG